MRLDQFLECNGISLVNVDQFDGYLIEVAVPPDWEPVHSPSVPMAWVWPSDPCKERFSANAVLTMARAGAVLDPAEAFDMLCEWQVEILPGIHEMERDSAVEHAGPGLMGTLELLINTDIGVLESVVMARIIPNEDHTLIAQLTLTALPESSVRRSQIGFGMIPASWVPPVEPESGAIPGAPRSLDVKPTSGTAEVH